MKFSYCARIALAVCGLMAASRSARAIDVTWTDLGVDNWADTTNWSNGELPTAAFFNERAVINNGGTAVVNSAISVEAGGVLLGNAAADSGTLRIESGGVLHNIVGTPPTGAGVSGQLNVGLNGTGTLQVLPGGTLTATGLLLAGPAASSVAIGGAGAGTATVTINGFVTLNRTTRVYPNAAFSTTSPSGSLFLQAAGNYIVENTPSGYATANISASTFLSGKLSMQFTGVTPTAASTWNLFETSALNGQFNSIEFSQNIPLGPGQKWVVDPVPAGPGRLFAQLRARQHLVLTVDRDTGAVAIANPGGGSLSLDGYTVRSTGGFLTPGMWNSLDDQNALGGDWLEAASNAQRVTELKPSDDALMTSGASRSLGSLFDVTPPVFGVPTEDIAFDYTTSDGQTYQGIVQYLGAVQPNNLLLTVNPATGQAQLKNTSSFTVSIDSYSVLSASGALNETGWNSLDEQNAAGGNWLEAESNANRLTEVQASGVTTLAPDATLNLGALFTTSGAQDLTFEFLLDGAITPMQGVVQFASLAIPGDFDDNGTVNGVDLAQWRGDFGVNGESDADGDGDSDGQDFLIWQRHFGMSSATPVASAIPEPATAALAWIVIAAAPLGRRRHGGDA
jgi:hypothetical protein